MPGGDDVRSLIRSCNEGFCSAFGRGSASEIAALYTVDAQLLPPNTEVVEGTNAIQEFWQGAIEMGLKGAKLESIEFLTLGDTAVEVGRYRLLVAGGNEADRGKYIVVWKNVRGMWKLHRDIWNSNKPA